MSLLSHFRRHQTADARAKSVNVPTVYEDLRRNAANAIACDVGQALASARTSRLATIFPVA